jgi:hydantoinase/carbamoylase family amidase
LDLEFRMAETVTPSDAMPQALAATVLERCDRLAACTEEPGALTRRFATPALAEAGEIVAGWMRDAGMSTRRDAIGNVRGRWEPEGGAASTLLLGSHLDTVRDAGRYDGALGVLVAIACVQRLRDEGRALPFAIEVLAFADEEGVRYGTAYLGSSAVAGTFDLASLERRDADGIRMADAIAASGGDAGALPAARRDPAGLVGYLEVHIEQGPVLEAEGLPVGVVTGIAGRTRADVVFAGMAGHAGTVPMGLRRDALAGAAEWIGAVEACARTRPGLLATVGEASVAPGASNVIPGRAALSLDIRHLEDGARESASSELRRRAETIAGERGLSVDWQQLQETGAVACAEALTRELEAAVGDAGVRVARLPSGAGHDAAVMSTVTDAGMLFVRCAGGISHNPAESVTAADVAVAIDVTSRAIDRLARARR